MDEVWREVKGYEGIYEVSNLGRVRSLERFRKNNGGLQKTPQRLLSLDRVNHKGYVLVHLSKNGTNKNISLHRLVADAFIPNPGGKAQVNHKDGDKRNNSVDNLEWVTGKENINHAFDAHLFKRGRAKPKKRTRPFKLSVIRDDGVIYADTNDAAKNNGVSRSAINLNIHGRTKVCAGHSFSYCAEGGAV